MPVDIVVGGQAGDEGKGKIAAYLSWHDDYDFCVRVGGPNAGHCISLNGRKYAMKNIPCGFVNPRTKLIIASGSYIDVELLLNEIKSNNLEDRVVIDRNATVISKEHEQEEKASDYHMKEIGSVGTGLGKAVRDKVERKDNIKSAKDIPEFAGYIADVPKILNNAARDGKKILIEGTQGIKLSLIHGEYPFVTSRDTTAGTFLSEAGLGPLRVRDVWVVFKPYVTRVAAGPLENEILDGKLLKKYHTAGGEIGSVSKRKRRIGSFELETAKKAIMLNSANKIAITHIDMLFGEDCNEKIDYKKVYELPVKARGFICKIENLGREYPYPKLELISTGENLDEMIDLRK